MPPRTTARCPWEDFIWFSDTMFEVPNLRRKSKAYTFVTLSNEHTPVNTIRVARLIMYYSSGLRSLRQAADRALGAKKTDIEQEIADTRNVLGHLQVLYDLRGEPEKYLMKMKSLLEPLERRTVLFRAINNRQDEWINVPKEKAGDAIVGMMMSKGLWV